MKTEKVFGTLFLLVLIMKLFDVIGANTFLVLLSGTLSFLYFFLAFYFFSDKNLKQQNIGLSIGGGIVLSIGVLGVLFKILQWPGGFVIQVFFLVSAIMLLSICFLLKDKKEELKVYYRNFIFRLLFWISLNLVFFIVPTPTWIKIIYREDPELVRLKIQAWENPYNMEYDKELWDYQRRKDSLELESMRRGE